MLPPAEHCSRQPHAAYVSQCDLESQSICPNQVVTLRHQRGHAGQQRRSRLAIRGTQDALPAHSRLLLDRVESTPRRTFLLLQARAHLVQRHSARTDGPSHQNLSAAPRAAKRLNPRSLLLHASAGWAAIAVAHKHHATGTTGRVRDCSSVLPNSEETVHRIRNPPYRASSSSDHPTRPYDLTSQCARRSIRATTTLRH